MILSTKQISKLTKETQINLLFLLYEIEDELEYKCESISRTIDYLQEGGG